MANLQGSFYFEKEQQKHLQNSQILDQRTQEIQKRLNIENNTQQTNNDEHVVQSRYNESLLDKINSIQQHSQLKPKHQKLKELTSFYNSLYKIDQHTQQDYAKTKKQQENVQQRINTLQRQITQEQLNWQNKHQQLRKDFESNLLKQKLEDEQQFEEEIYQDLKKSVTNYIKDEVQQKVRGLKSMMLKQKKILKSSLQEMKSTLQKQEQEKLYQDQYVEKYKNQKQELFNVEEDFRKNLKVGLRNKTNRNIFN